jgi:nitrogen fixation protein NifU and related proteins
MEEVYRENILEHYKRPRNWSPPAPELERVDLQFHDLNPLCGDELTVKLAVDGDERVTGVRFEGHGCAISQAAASMASEELIGMEIDEAATLDAGWMLELLGVNVSATRRKCALLSLKVVRHALTGEGTWPTDPE